MSSLQTTAVTVHQRSRELEIDSPMADSAASACGHQH